MKKSNILITTATLLKQLQIPVTERSLQKELENHPDYPSVAAISDVFNKWDIPNAAFHVRAENLASVPTPFIAYMSAKDKEFEVVESFTLSNVILAGEKDKKQHISFQKFSTLYKDTILVAEKIQESGEPDYKTKRREELLEQIRIPFLFTLLTAIFLSLTVLRPGYLAAVTLSQAMLLLFKTAGLIVTVLLLIQSIDKDNTLVQKLCSGDNKDCDSILSSHAAKISNGFSWSEAGFFYFAGTWLALILAPPSSLLSILLLLNLVSLPYTFYSIYYQARIARKWCILCCMVQATLWLEFFAFIPQWHTFFTMPSTTAWLTLFTSFSLPVISWIFCKPYLLKAQQVAPLTKQVRKFKYNKDLFNKLLTDNPLHLPPGENMALVLGNRQAENVITIVSSPYCPPCAIAHKALHQLFNNRNDLQLQIVFATGNYASDHRAKVAAHLMSLKEQMNEAELKTALHDWYDQKNKDYASWSKSYPANTVASQEEILAKQNAWCKQINLEGTPTILINGRKLPKPYMAEDLQYFV